jgi:hypothetical protein
MTKTDIRTLAILAVMTLIASSAVSTAQARKTVRQPQHAAASTATQNLAPEAAAMRDAQKLWPGRPLCDEGGYRIRPCDVGDKY